MSRKRAMRQDVQNNREEVSGRKKARPKPFSKFRFYFLNILLGFVIFVLLAVMMIYAFCSLHETTVSGSTIYTEDEIKAYVLDDSYSAKNAVYAFAKNLIQPKKDIPFVKNIKVKLTSYDKIKITVTQKDLFGRVSQSDGAMVYFDEDGQVVEISERVIESVMPVTGVTVDDATVGSQVSLDDKQLTFMLNLLKALDKYDIAVSSLAFDEKGDISVAYANILISVGDSSYLEEKIMRLPQILPNLEGQTGTLHLENFSSENTDIVFEKPKS